MCYTFDLLGPEFSAAHVRKCIEGFETTVRDGWVCWSLSNHDVPRHATRLTPKSGDPDRTARFAILLLAALRGSICLYQGEELGLEEAEIAWEDLRDPYGIRFWPAFKGRDGCRTPMPWSGDKDHAGFTTAAKPWLRVPAEHVALAVDTQDGREGSVLEHYRQTLAFRKAHAALLDGDMEFLDLDEDVLAFTRKKGDDRLLFVFNLRGGPQEVKLPQRLAIKELVGMPGLSGSIVDGVVLVEAEDGFCARI
jgi:alpha-glucosidase